ncbi:MAG: threonine/serine exporter [Bacteroides sp.]|nr:threonine/serine exporter [Bacteroidales bacterium]MBD5253117.1 threonine/serine exporter [Barnesiella sp.]MBD5344600.1 threonine/serine exporter [Bacteroides sp.]MBD5369036.1 threonine/serine exporter [Bacteroides sp.]
MWQSFIQDAFFAALAAVGFSAISRPPVRLYAYCAIIAAAGHSCRFLLINLMDMHVAAASFLAALLVGLLAVAFCRPAHTPPEACLFPALLPMIPGIYAYKAFGAMALSVIYSGTGRFDHYFSLLADNGLTCIFILIAMVVGGTIPIFMFKKIAFQATR